MVDDRAIVVALDDVDDQGPEGEAPISCSRR